MYFYPEPALRGLGDKLGSSLQAVAVAVGTHSFGLYERSFPRCWIALPMTRSRWVANSPLRLPHKDRSSIDAAGIAPPRIKDFGDIFLGNTLAHGAGLECRER